MALTSAEIDAIAARVIEIGEAKRDEDLAKWEADRPDRERKDLLRRVSDLEESRVSWWALFGVLIASELAFGIASRIYE